MMLDLEAIRKRVEAATAGPWSADKNIMAPWGKEAGWSIRPHRQDGGMTGFQIAWCEGESKFASTKMMGGTTEGNAQFLAHSREDVPALLAECERLRKVLEEAYDALEHQAEYSNLVARLDKALTGKED